MRRGERGERREEERRKEDLGWTNGEREEQLRTHNTLV
jgi:hypothetical protein